MRFVRSLILYTLISLILEHIMLRLMDLTEFNEIRPYNDEELSSNL